MDAWTGSDDVRRHDVLPVHGALKPTIDEILNDRLQDAINGYVLKLYERVEKLEATVDALHAGRWPARMYRAEAAEYLGISPSWFDELVQRGHIAFVELPGLGHRSYLKTTLDEYLSTSTPATPLAGTETAART